jgi:cytoskeleton protein RodZ
MKELGEYLRSERLNRQMSLESINENTRISPEMLEAIENGDFQSIGAATLIRGFLRAYCREVGIDSEPILEEYDRKICECDCTKEGYQQFQKWLRPFRRRNWIWVAVLLLCVLASLGLLLAKDWISERKARMSSPPESMRTATYPQQEQELLSDLALKDVESPGNNTAATVTSSQQDEGGQESQGTPVVEQSEPVTESQKELTQVLEPIQPLLDKVKAQEKESGEKTVMEAQHGSAAGVIQRAIQRRRCSSNPFYTQKPPVVCRSNARDLDTGEHR